MAETEAEAVLNGTAGLGAEEEDERLKQRPADIDADVREMERRKRVEAIMSSKLFREELERVLDQQLNEGGGAAPLLQRIREMVGGAGAARLQAGAFKGANCVQPINDIRGIEGMGYEKGEKILRCKLAAVYRLVDLHGWTQAGVSGQITARLNTAAEHFLTAPRGLLPHETTASSLVKLDALGGVIDQGTTNLPPNLTGFRLQALVHAARPDVRCVLHVRSPAALAVSALRSHLLPLCTEAALLGELAYHRIPPGDLDNSERDKLVRALGPSAKVLVLSNAGALCCGETLEEAFHLAKCLTAACDVQLKCASLPQDQLSLIDDDTRKQLYEESRRPPADGVKWRVGGEEFEALMRMLDNAGYRTGYIYRHPLVKGDVPKPKNDVEVPPAVSSLGYLLEEEELYRQGLWKRMDGRKGGDRTRWLNSPNVYQKVEVLETGTNDPKKITKWVDSNNEEWVQDGSPAHSSTPVKIDAALQFVPKNTNPKEFKQLQQQIKDNRRADKISAGPQSHILEGVTWDEANKLQAEDALATHTGDHVVLMGAASKGIIQRGYQHNATVYSAPYARNPFDSVSDRELDEYKRTVERKARGEYDADLSESEAAQLTSPDCQPSETEEESRDEHRILRIETKQAPRPSQPEVVLSDDSTAEFLANERHVSGHTRGESLHLLSTRSCSSCSNQDPVFTANLRSRHEFPRTSNFNSIVKVFESPETEIHHDPPRSSRMPKCRTGLDKFLRDVEISSVASQGKEVELRRECDSNSDKMSVCSAWSIEWDAGHKGTEWMRTRSLTRAKSTRKSNLYRTRSHAGFISGKDPEPKHFHLPRCKSCDAYNLSYAWEVTSRKLGENEYLDDTLCPNSTIFDHDNSKEQLNPEIAIVKVKETTVPVMKAIKLDHPEVSTSDFVESQEFNDDGYLDTGGSFSSENLTVIEKLSPVGQKEEVKSDQVQFTQEDNIDLKDSEVVNDADDSPKDDSPDTANSTEAEFDSASDKDNDFIDDQDCGEYMNFSDELTFEETVYESPVRDLVEKDIRNYTVPMTVYCEDYSSSSYSNVRRSPPKSKPLPKSSSLEPILEESKSSYGEETSTSVASAGSADAEIEKNNVLENDEFTESIERKVRYSETIIDIVAILDDIVTQSISVEIVNEKNNNSEEVNVHNKSNATADVSHMTVEVAQSTDVKIIPRLNNDCIQVNSSEHELQDLVYTHSDNDEVITEEESVITVKEREVVNISKEDDFMFKVPKLPEQDRSESVSGSVRDSFESTVEFERIEAVSEVMGLLLDRASMDNKLLQQLDLENKEFLCVVDRRKAKSIQGHNLDTSDIKTIERQENEGAEMFTQEIVENLKSSSFDDAFKENAENLTHNSPVLSSECSDENFLQLGQNLNEDPITVELSEIRSSESVHVTNSSMQASESLHREDIECYRHSKEYVLENPPVESLSDSFPEELEEQDSLEAIENFLDQNKYKSEKSECTYTLSKSCDGDDKNLFISKNNVTQFKCTTMHNEETVETEKGLDESYEKNKDFVFSGHQDSSNYTVDNNMAFASEVVEFILRIIVDTSIEDFQTHSVDAESDISKTTDINPMDVAFVENSYHESITSSPVKDDSIHKFDPPGQSPIRTVSEASNSFLESPFTNKASVITMSQTEQRGGLKFWISFDDNTSQTMEVACGHKRLGNLDEKTPSFLFAEFSNSKCQESRINEDNLEGLADLSDAHDRFNSRKSIFCRSLESDSIEGSRIEASGSFETAVTASEGSSGAYITCRSGYNRENLHESTECVNRDYCRKVYDSSKSLKNHRGVSWPPFEDTLFYKILSKFKMSESFDSAEFEKYAH